MLRGGRIRLSIGPDRIGTFVLQSLLPDQAIDSVLHLPHVLLLPLREERYLEEVLSHSFSDWQTEGQALLLSLISQPRLLARPSDSVST